MGSFTKSQVSGHKLSDPERVALQKLDEFIDAMNLVIDDNAVANDAMLIDDVTRSISRLSRTVLVAAASRMMKLHLEPESTVSPLDLGIIGESHQPITRQ